MRFFEFKNKDLESALVNTLMNMKGDADEILSEEEYLDLYLTEDIKSKLKALGLAGLLSLGLALGASDVQAKDYNAQELKDMGFTSVQATNISTMPEKLQQILVKGQLEKTGPTPEFDAGKLKSTMSSIMDDDHMVTGYKIKGDTLIIDLNNDRPITNFEHYGFDDNYKLSIIKKTGVSNVKFNPKVDPELRPVSSVLSKKGK